MEEKGFPVPAKYSGKRAGVNFALVLKVRNNKDDLLIPAFWRITYQRKLKYIATGYEFSKTDWSDFVKKDLQKHKDRKATLTAYLDNVLRPAIDELVGAGNFSFEALNNKLGKSDITTVNDAFNRKINDLMDSGSVGNASIYKTAYISLQRYQHYRKLKNRKDKGDFLQKCRESRHMTRGKEMIIATADIKFNDITVKWLDDCEQFWRDAEISDATMGIYMRTFRSLINNRGGDPYLSGARYPFGMGKYEIPEGGRREIALSIEDIRKIEQYVPINQSEAIAQDVFMFLFYGNGMNFGDMCRLQYSNIDAATKEIVFQRKKTLKKGERPVFIYVPIISPLVEIINKRGNKNQTGYIFPFLNEISPSDELRIKEQIGLSLQPINNALKGIAAILGVDTGITTGYARNSYITHLTAELMISPLVVKKMVGHSTKGDVTAGYVNLNAKKRRSINEQLLPDGYETKGVMQVV